MNHDALSTAMLWVGALFVVTPFVLTGTVIGVLWFERRRGRRRPADASASSLGAPPD